MTLQNITPEFVIVVYLAIGITMTLLSFVETRDKPVTGWTFITALIINLCWPLLIPLAIVITWRKHIGDL